MNGAFLFLPSECGPVVDAYRQLDCDLNVRVYRVLTATFSRTSRGWLDDVIVATIPLGLA